MILKCQLGRALCCLFNALPYGTVAKGVDPPDRSPCTLAGPAASYIELDGRIARLDAWHEGGGDSNVYAAAMQGYADNRILLDQWSAIANREAVNVLASVNGGIDFAKGAWRLANGEVNWENGLSVGAAILGPLTGRVGKTFSLGRKVVAAESGVWKLNPFQRGQQIEQALGHNLPNNFPVIDRFENGLATSIKSLDLDAATYQSASTLNRTLSGYVDNVAGFQGRTWAGVRIRSQDITARSLDLAIPHGGSAAQQAIINQTVKYGASRGVTVNVIPFP